MQTATDKAKVLLLVTLSISVAAVSTFACLRLHQVGIDETAIRVSAQTELHDTATVARDQVEKTAAAAREDVHSAAHAATTAMTQIGGLAKTAQGTAAASTGLITATSKSVELTTHRLDDECPTSSQVTATWQHCGTLADFNQTLKTVRGTSGQVETSLRGFNQHEATYFQQETSLYVDAKKAVEDFDKQINDPNIGKTIANWQEASSDGAAIVHDGHTWLHAKLYPTKKKGVLNGIDATGDHVKHWLPSLF